MLIRDASATDAGACADIYAAYVRETVVTFETEPSLGGGDGRADRVFRGEARVARRGGGWHGRRICLWRTIQGARRVPMVLRG